MSTSTVAPGIENDEWERGADKEVAAPAGAMVSHAACDASKKADDLTASASVGIQKTGDGLSRHSAKRCRLKQASQAGSTTVRNGRTSIESAKQSGMVENLAHLIRKHPFPAILIAIGLGWFTSRKLRT